MFDFDTELTFMYAFDCKNSSRVIENQERQGQQSVVRNQRLPKRVNETGMWQILSKGITDSMDYDERHEISTQNNIAYTKEQYEKMGIVILGEYDDLFYNVQLPSGWQIKATSHSMWNELIDDKGRKRANFFYKAAFYDRDAFTNFNTRFHTVVDHVASEDADYDVWKNSDFKGVVKDGDTIIFETECVPSTDDYSKDDKITDALRNNLENYMMANYPNYRDINAYWD